MLQTLGETDHFIYKYDDAVPIAQTRARALMASCETDWAALLEIFPAGNAAFTADRKIIVQVELKLIFGGPLGGNFGYDPSTSTVISIDPLRAQPDTAATNEIIQAIFVMEAAEVLEAFGDAMFAPETWGRGASNGEALSRVCGAVLHPRAYYALPGLIADTGIEFVRGGFTEAWMNSNPRQDFISTVFNSDTFAPAVACSILFIYYLDSQLNFSLTEIATAHGWTLAEKFQSLTGRTTGWDEFTALIDKFYPLGHPVAMPSDNPFPLLDASLRYVRVAVADSATPGRIIGQGQADVSPGFPCPPSLYQFTLRNNLSSLQCWATCRGFAQPIFAWNVNGNEVAGLSGTIDPMATVRPVTASGAGVAPPAVQPVRLDCSVGRTTYNEEGQSQASPLLITPLENPGDVTISIEVDVTERFASSDVTTATSVGTVHTVGIEYEQRYYTDRRACEKQGFETVSRLFKMNPLWQIMPDPPPEAYTVVSLLAQLFENVQQLEAKDPAFATQARNLLQQAFGPDLANLQKTLQASGQTEGRYSQVGGST